MKTRTAEERCGRRAVRIGFSVSGLGGTPRRLCSQGVAEIPCVRDRVESKFWGKWNEFDAIGEDGKDGRSLTGSTSPLFSRGDVRRISDSHGEGGRFDVINDPTVEILKHFRMDAAFRLVASQLDIGSRGVEESIVAVDGGGGDDLVPIAVSDHDAEIANEAESEEGAPRLVLRDVPVEDGHSGDFVAERERGTVSRGGSFVDADQVNSFGVDVIRASSLFDRVEEVVDIGLGVIVRSPAERLVTPFRRSKRLRSAEADGDEISSTDFGGEAKYAFLVVALSVEYDDERIGVARLILFREERPDGSRTRRQSRESLRGGQLRGIEPLGGSIEAPIGLCLCVGHFEPVDPSGHLENRPHKPHRRAKDELR